jgi:hypothetical protein
MTKKMKNKVDSDLSSLVTVAIKEARSRATREYLSRHPVATNAVQASVREAYLSRKANAIAPNIVYGMHSHNLVVLRSRAELVGGVC